MSTRAPLPLLSLLLLASVALPSGSAWAGEPAAGPPVAVTPETRFDAGTVVRGVSIHRSFPVRNAGGSTLRITNLESSCNCAAADYSPVVEPGAEGFVAIRVDTDDLSGPVEKFIVATTNDPAAPSIRFTVSTTVDDVILVVPGRRASLGAIAREEGAVRRFGLRSADGRPLRITAVELEEGCVDYEVESAEEGKVAVLAVVVPPEFQRRNGSDLFVARFAVHTDHPRLPLLRLTAQGELKDRLSAAPREVRFGFVGRKVVEGDDPDAPALARDLSVVYLGSEPLRIESVNAHPDFLRAELLEESDDPNPTIRLRIRLGTPSGPFSGYVRAVTNFGTLYWPVTGQIK